ncbi:hypothetical protein ACJJIF_09330 [Microbulbifer sp. SSSA002]|uniref:hypothetical protein n=1 Tax=Microbulbifer sp. SSSA002 TaxID=3243376 RepID=UPI0040395A79
MSTEVSLRYIKNQVEVLSDKKMSDIYPFLAHSFEEMVPYCKGFSFGIIKHLMLGQWYRREEPVLDTSAEEFLASQNDQTLNRISRSFLYWASENKDQPEDNPYRHILGYYLQGGRFIRFEQGVLDVYDSYGEKCVFPLEPYINRLIR